MSTSNPSENPVESGESSSGAGSQNFSVQNSTQTPTADPSTMSPNSANASVQRQPSSQKQCWVCFATEDDDPDPEWVRPCRCRGSTMWVHQKCLQRWVDEKQKGNTFAAVACGSCGFNYIIIYPQSNFATVILEKIDRMIAKVCPLMTGGIIIVSLYWTAVTYGAVTVMQVMGAERGMQALEKADPVLLLVGLPTIPIMLITIKLIRWEDKIVEWLRDRYIAPRNGNRQRLLIPGDAAPIGGQAPAGNDQAAMAQQQIIRDAASATRVLCGALALPTIAVTIGKLVFGDSVGPPLRRAFYGAAIFMAVRGATKIYFKYQQILRQKNRKIIDYEPPQPQNEPVAPAGNDQGAGAANANVPLDVQP